MHNYCHMLRLSKEAYTICATDQGHRKKQMHKILVKLNCTTMSIVLLKLILLVAGADLYLKFDSMVVTH